MKNINKYLAMVILIWSCNSNTNQKTKNMAVIDVLNGMGKKDTVRYTCDSCDKYIKSEDILNKVIERATKEANLSLNNPLSFIPRAIKIKVAPRDSLFYYSTNKHVDSCLMIDVDYESIGKNAYGTEGQVNSSSLIFLVGSEIKDDFLEQIKINPLGITNEGKIVDRILSLYDIDGEGHFTILPTLSKPYTLIVKSSISCIDKDATLTLMFTDKSEVRLKNWNDFNCKGTAYFNLNADVLENLKTSRIDHISFYNDKQQFARVRQNEADYFIQYVALLGN